VVEKLKVEYDIELEWRPFYLRPNTPPEGLDLPDYVLRARANGSEERLRLIADSYGLPFASTKRSYYTRRAHEATAYAISKGRGNDFHRVVFRKVYADGEDPASWKSLREAAEEVGLDGEDMQREVDEGKFTDEVASQVQWAYQIGVTGVPTYAINDRYAIVGAQPYEAFQRALAQILNKTD